MLFAARYLPSGQIAPVRFIRLTGARNAFSAAWTERFRRILISLLMALPVVMLVGCGSNGLPPSIATQPMSAAVISGQSSSFSVVATGTGPLRYQWFKNGAAIAGAASATYMYGPATLSDSGTVFAVSVSNAEDTVTSTSATLTVNPIVPTLSIVAIPPENYGDAPFPVSAVSTSPGPISFGVNSGPAIISGSTVTVMGTGTVVLTATQSAAGQFAAAATTASFPVGPPLPTTVLVSSSALSYRVIAVGSAVTKQVARITNTGSVTLFLGPTLAGDPSFSLVPGQTCGATLLPGASCAIAVAYAPLAASGADPQTATVDFNFQNAATGTESIDLSGMSGVLTGTVAGTDNPQVALYTVGMPFAGSVTVNFGPTPEYGRQTWTQTAAAPGNLSFFVAGMLPNTTYHMQASVQFDAGGTASDADHTFTTGTPGFQTVLSATTTAGMTPQSGVEQMAVSNGPYSSLLIADLQGNTLWSYAIPGDYGGYNVEGAKLMSNGDFLITLGQGSGFALGGGTPLPDLDAVREINLAGDTVRQVTITTLNQQLQAAGYSLTLQQFHHDVIPMANGHWIVLSNVLKTFEDLPGYPGTTAVLGDVVIDLDQNLDPVWVWNSFDHLDVNRHPWNFPDWTHSNAIVYSPTDGNLLISMRHQNWVMKLDYRDGAGTGDILWRLGQGGDFALVNGTDPTDWNWAQHFPSFFSPNTAGVFSLGLMDNGDDRVFPPGVVCDTAGQPACLYTSIPVFQIDEGAMTATLTSNQILPPNLYSFFGGNTELLANGNTEYDLAGTYDGGPSAPSTADIFEVTPGSTPQTVWHIHSATNAYRAYRIPSLYPGVQW